VRRRLVPIALLVLVTLAFPAAALAHDQPETDQSRWVMADSIPLYVEEEDYYTPEWALSEEEWQE
jgi:hypothetical protein